MDEKITEENSSDKRSSSEMSDKEETKSNKEEDENGDAKSDNDDEGEEEIFEVEKILKMKMQGGKRTFFVSWKGYPASENSWEPEENLDGAKDLVKKYLKAMEGKGKDKGGTKRKAKASSVERAKSSSSTPASTTRKPPARRQEPESDVESEPEKEEKDSEESDYDVPKKKGRPSKGKSSKENKSDGRGKDRKSGMDQSPQKSTALTSNSLSRRMNQNLRWLESDSDSDSDKEDDSAAKKPEAEEKKEKTTSPGSPPEIQNEATETKTVPPLKMTIKRASSPEPSETKKESKKDKKKKEKEALHEEETNHIETNHVDAGKSAISGTLKFLGILRPDKSKELHFYTEDSKTKKKETYSLNEVLSADPKGVARYLASKVVFKKSGEAAVDHYDE